MLLCFKKCYYYINLRNLIFVFLNRFENLNYTFIYEYTSISDVKLFNIYINQRQNKVISN